MALRNIVKIGDPALRKNARKVTNFDDKLHLLLDDMKETMEEANGVGLAAPQVGINRSIVTIDVGEGLVELINPEILETSGEQINLEGCLSVEDTKEYVRRPEHVKVRAQNRTGEWVEYDAYDYFAIAVCHETDHLNGVLFVDKIADLTEEELEELRKRDEEADDEDFDTQEDD